jgi:hypothetical protein
MDHLSPMSFSRLRLHLRTRLDDLVLTGSAVLPLSPQGRWNAVAIVGACRRSTAVVAQPPPVPLYLAWVHHRNRGELLMLMRILV